MEDYDMNLLEKGQIPATKAKIYRILIGARNSCKCFPHVSSFHSFILTTDLPLSKVGNQGRYKINHKCWARHFKVRVGI